MPTNQRVNGLADGGRRNAQGARVLAARIVVQVLRGRSLAALFPEFLSDLPPTERAVVKEFCFGTIRWWFRLDAVLNQLVKRPLKPKDQDIRALMMLGLYQLVYSRVAEHAAVAETVEAARKLGKPWAAGLVNGVLRSFQRHRESLLAQADRDPAARFAVPSWLAAMLQEARPECWEEIASKGNERPPMSLRVNTARIARSDYLERLRQAGIAAETIEGTESGLLLGSPVDTHDLPGFDEGMVSVQDGAAQLAAPLLGVRPGFDVLDACAAPGGKSCHILESAEGIRLVAVDRDRQRLALVRDNLARLGLEAEVFPGDVSRPEGEWAARAYDRILIDAPCSATGVIRRHPDIKLLRRSDDIPALMRTQQRILDAAWTLLKPGGRLVYATCSVLPGENEAQITAFLARHPDAGELAIGGDWGQARGHGRQILPGESAMDGFYYALLEKAG